MFMMYRRGSVSLGTWDKLFFTHLSLKYCFIIFNIEALNCVIPCPTWNTKNDRTYPALIHMPSPSLGNIGTTIHFLMCSTVELADRAILRVSMQNGEVTEAGVEATIEVTVIGAQ